MFRNRREPSIPVFPAAALTLRQLESDDRGEVARLAALDSTPAPAGPWLLVEVEGRPLAALGLGDGGFVADPFSRTAELRPLLELRASQLRARDRRAARPLPRAVPRPRPALAVSAAQAAPWSGPRS